MRFHGKNGGIITFRASVGDGEYKGHKFRLAVSCTPDGALLGMPVVTWDDGSTVTFELDDIIPHAFNYATNHGGFEEDEI